MGLLYTPEVIHRQEPGVNGVNGVNGVAPRRVDVVQTHLLHGVAAVRYSRALGRFRTTLDRVSL